MYYNGQIVYDKELQKPIKVESEKEYEGSTWCWNMNLQDTTHFVDSLGNIFLPSSIEHAEKMLLCNEIQPYRIGI